VHEKDAQSICSVDALFRGGMRDVDSHRHCRGFVFGNPCCVSLCFTSLCFTLLQSHGGQFDATRWTFSHSTSFRSALFWFHGVSFRIVGPIIVSSCLCLRRSYCFGLSLIDMDDDAISFISLVGLDH
jgi:hypothetical protein